MNRIFWAGVGAACTVGVAIVWLKWMAEDWIRGAR